MRALLLSLSVLLATAALAQDVPTHLRGTIAAIDGSVLTVTEKDGVKTKIRLTSEARIEAVETSSLADVSPGTHVAVANTGPNGLQDALEVHILPGAVPGKKGVEDGQSRWDLGRRSRMTIGIAKVKAESYDGQNLTLTFNGDETTIQVRPNTPVVRLLPGTTADLEAGAGIFLRDGERQPDGSILADGIVVERTAKPPM